MFFANADRRFFREALQWFVSGVSIVAVLLLHRQLRELRDKTEHPRVPQLIIAMRHGESEANVDHSKYGDKGDPHVELTQKGREQAQAAAEHLAKIVGKRPVAAFISPYTRTRETANIVLEHLVAAGVSVVMRREDPRLREREFMGSFQHEKPDMSEAQTFSRFYFRSTQGGESCADVYDRTSSFMDSLFRCFGRNGSLSDGAVVIFTHGLTMRVLTMRWMHWPPETFLQTTNPGNCDVLVMERQAPRRGPERGRTWFELTAESLQTLGLGATTRSSRCSLPTATAESSP